MANPRKFSEKIALHNQKQAEETAAFEAILRDVSAATRGGPAAPRPNKQLHIQQNMMQQYRGGSLPNVNQMVNANSGIDLQKMEMHASHRIDRMHPRDRGRQPIGPVRSRPFQMENARADCSPYGTGSYLSPPPDTNWRRTNSDSAIHSSSSLGGRVGGDAPSPNTPPMHRRIHEVVGDSGLSTGPYSWDPKKRPKSCEVPNINIYPSAEQDPQLHVPISSNTGSLPDLTILQFPSPLTTPLDLDGGGDQQQVSSMPDLTKVGHASHNHHPLPPYIFPQPSQQAANTAGVANMATTTDMAMAPSIVTSNVAAASNMAPSAQPPAPKRPYMGVARSQVKNYSNSQANLSPTGSHHMNMGPPQHPNGSPAQSPGSQRRRMNPSGPSPLVLQANGNQSMRVPLSPPVPTLDPSQLPMDPRIRQQYMLQYMQQQQRQQQQQQQQQQQHHHQHHHQQQQQAGHQLSPTQSSPHQHGLLPEGQRVPPHPTHLGPVPKVCVTSHENDPPEASMTQYRNNISEGGCQSPTSPHSAPSYSPSQSPGLPPAWNNSVFEMDNYHLQQQQQQTNALQQQFEHFNMHQQGSLVNDKNAASSSMVVTSSGPTTIAYSQANSPPGVCASPEYNHQRLGQPMYGGEVSLNNLASINNSIISSMANSRIPDIVLTGMSDGSFDADFLGSVSDEALKDGLVPIDLDGLQMLTDPSMVADPDTENSFRLDQL